MKKKNSFKWLVCLICLMGVAAQMNVMAGGVKKVSSMELMRNGDSPNFLTKNVDSDFQFDPFVYTTKTDVFCSLIVPEGDEQNLIRFVTTYKGSKFAKKMTDPVNSVSSLMKANREIFFQKQDTNTIFCYFADYDSNTISIGKTASKLAWFISYHEDSVYLQLPCNQDKYTYCIVHAVSPNKRYLVYDIFTVGGNKQNSKIEKTVRLRWDTQTDVIDQLEEPVGYNNTINKRKPKLMVTDEGEVLEVYFNRTNLKGLKEAFAKESMDFFDYSLTKEYIYVQVNHFPLHSRGNVVNYLLKNQNFEHPELKIMKDNLLLIYGFSQTKDSVFWNTINYDLLSQKCGNEQQTYVMDRWTQQMKYKKMSTFDYTQFGIYPLGLEELNDGSFVAFANWVCQVEFKNNAYKGFLDFNLHVLHCVLDSDLKVKAHGMQYNEYLSAPDKNFNINFARAYSGNDGDKAVLFVPISQKNSKNKLCSKKQLVQKQYYTADTYMKVLTVDSENHETTSIVKSRAKYDLMMGQPKYDPVAKDWLLTLMSNKNMRLEHWKIK